MSISDKIVDITDKIVDTPSVFVVIIILLYVLMFASGYSIGSDTGRREPVCLHDGYFVIQGIEQPEGSYYTYTLEHAGRIFKWNSVQKYNIGDSLRVTK